jgi:pyruvate-formate lyase-activating enzyme
VLYDASRFHRTYLRGAPLPIVLDGARITEVSADRVRSAISLIVTSDAGVSLTLFVEPRVETARAFAATRDLHVSYYADDSIAGPDAARLVRQVVSLIEAAETTAPREGLVCSLEAPTGLRLEVRINRECNEECAFCNTPEASDTILGSREAVLATLAGGFESGHRAVTLTGRETTLDPNLVDYVRRARELGYTTIGVQTNATTFGSGPLLDALVEAGMNFVSVSLHTFDPEVFGAIVGKPRLLEKALAGLRALQRHPHVETVLVTVLTTKNLAELPSLVARVADELPHARTITVSPMAPVGDGRSRIDLVPRPSDVSESLARAVAIARARNVRIVVPTRCGMPMCLMPPGTESVNQELDNPPLSRAEPAKSKLARCHSCVYDRICSGVWTEVLAAYGEDEWKPVTTLPAGVALRRGR